MTVNWLRSYFIKRSKRVKYGDVLSSPATLTHGVPQVACWALLSAIFSLMDC